MSPREAPSNRTATAEPIRDASAPRRSARIGEFAAVFCLYALACAFFFFRVLFDSGRVIPWDFLDASYPHYYYVTKWLHQGVVPLWDPHVGFGIPMTGMASQLLYPPTYLQALFGHPLNVKTAEAFLIMHVCLAAVGMYYLCRHFAFHRFACFAAGLVFAFGGFFPNRIQHTTWIHAAAWFPFAALALERFARFRRVKYVAWLTVVLLIMLLAGFWQQAMYSMYFLGFRAVWLALAAGRSGAALRKALVLPLAFGVACVTAVLMDAAEFLPTLETASQCVRQKLTLADSSAGAMGFVNLMTILVPGVFAGPEGDFILTKLGDPSLLYSYTGTVTLILLAYSVAVRRWSADRVYLWSGVAVGVLLAVGPLTPLYGLFFRFVPGFAFFRRPLAMYFFVIFSVSLLAAGALDDIVKRITGPLGTLQRVAFWLCAGAVLVAFIAYGVRAGLPVLALPRPAAALTKDIASVLGRGGPLSAALFGACAAIFWRLRIDARRTRLYCAALVLLVFADLWYFNSGRIFDSAPLKAGTPVDSKSIYGDVLPGGGAIVNSTAEPHRTGIAGYGGLFDNAGHILGYENPGGYIAFRFQRYHEYMSAVSGPESPLLSLANVRYVLTSPPFMTSTGTGQLSPMNNRVALPNGPVARLALVDTSVHGWYRLYRNDRAVPRYYFSAGVEIVPGSGARLARMDSAEFVQSGKTILESGSADGIENCAGAPVKVLEYTPNRVRLEAVSPGTCLLVATDAYHPGWKAYVDGREAPVVAANHIFRGMRVGPGTHDVDMRFEPASFYRGLAVSGAAVCLAAVAFILLRKRLDRLLQA